MPSCESQRNDIIKKPSEKVQETLLFMSGAPLHVNQMSKPLVNTLFVLLLCIWLLVAEIEFIG